MSRRKWPVENRPVVNIAVCTFFLFMAQCKKTVKTLTILEKTQCRFRTIGLFILEISIFKRKCHKLTKFRQNKATGVGGVLRGRFLGVFRGFFGCFWCYSPFLLSFTIFPKTPTYIFTNNQLRNLPPIKIKLHHTTTAKNLQPTETHRQNITILRAIVTVTL